MNGSRIVRFVMFAMIVPGGAGTAFAADIEYSFTTIDVHEAPETEAFGINDSGQIAGSYCCSPGIVGFGGFLYSAGSFTPINVPVPGASDSIPSGINGSGQIVGWFYNADLRPLGFLDTGGSFTTINVPGASDSLASGITIAVTS